MLLGRPAKRATDPDKVGARAAEEVDQLISMYATSAVSSTTYGFTVPTAGLSAAVRLRPSVAAPQAAAADAAAAAAASYGIPARRSPDR